MRAAAKESPRFGRSDRNYHWTYLAYTMVLCCLVMSLTACAQKLQEEQTEGPIELEIAEVQELETDEAVMAMARAYVQNAVDTFLPGIIISDSRITDIHRIDAAPDPQGRGQIELWSISYALKSQDPEPLKNLPASEFLIEDAVHRDYWLACGDDGDSYQKPVLVVWRDADGTCTQEGTEIVGTIMEKYRNCYSLCASDYLYQKLGVRTKKITGYVDEDEDITCCLLDKQGFSLYIPETWVEGELERKSSEGATRRCAGYWHDPEDQNDGGIAVYHVDGVPDDDTLAADLLAAAADAGVELATVSEYYADMNISGGTVRVCTGSAADDLLLQTFAVSDGGGGAWEVVTRRYRDSEEYWVWMASTSFLPKPQSELGSESNPLPKKNEEEPAAETNIEDAVWNAVSIDPNDYGITQDELASIDLPDFSQYTLAELITYYLYTDGAGAEGSSEELYQRFMKDPNTVLCYLAMMGDQKARGGTSGTDTAAEEICSTIAGVVVAWYNTTEEFAEIIENYQTVYPDGQVYEVLVCMQNKLEAAIQRHS